jgi:hypothetical protein
LLTRMRAPAPTPSPPVPAKNCGGDDFDIARNKHHKEITSDEVGLDPRKWPQRNIKR